MNRQQQRVALLFGLLLISVALLGCASDRGAALRSDDVLARASATLTDARIGLPLLKSK